MFSNVLNFQKNLVALVLGLVFGLGLIIAEMSNPAKVLAFLDVSGAWDPSLAVVMASALATLSLAQRLLNTNTSDDAMRGQMSCDANRIGIDRSLILGSMLFGLGWGLSGICPGPAFVGLGNGQLGSLVFFTAMYAGFLMFRWLNRQR